MKVFSKALPSSNNVKGSGTGSPSADTNKMSDALVEIRSSVPDSPADVNSVTSSQLTALINRANSLVSRLQALKTIYIADPFTRTSVGTNYLTVTGSEFLAIVSNQLAPSGGAGLLVTSRRTKTWQMYAKATIAEYTSVMHPAVLCAHSADASSGATSNYRGQYNPTLGRWELYRRLAGTSTLVGTLTESIPAKGYTLNVASFEGYINVEVNGVKKITYADSNPLTGKQAGIAFAWSSTTDNAQRVDDLIIGDC